METSKLRNVFCWFISLFSIIGVGISYIGTLMNHAVNPHISSLGMPLSTVGIGLLAISGILYIVNRILDQSFKETWTKHDRRIHGLMILRIEMFLFLIVLTYQTIQINLRR